jgi:hypothetical protein
LPLPLKLDSGALGERRVRSDPQHVALDTPGAGEAPVDQEGPHLPAHARRQRDAPARIDDAPAVDSPELTAEAQHLAERFARATGR